MKICYQDLIQDEISLMSRWPNFTARPIDLNNREALKNAQKVLSYNYHYRALYRLMMMPAAQAILVEYANADFFELLWTSTGQDFIELLAQMPKHRLIQLASSAESLCLTMIHGGLAAVESLLSIEDSQNIRGARVQAFRWAAFEHQTALCKRLLEFGEDYLKLAHARRPALLFAIASRSTEIALLLLKYPTVQNSLSSRENYLLHGASVMGQSIVAKRLLEFRAVQNNAHTRRNSVLKAATTHRDLELTEKLLGLPNVIETLKKNLTWNLYAAYIHGYYEVLDRFLKVEGVEELLEAQGMDLLKLAISYSRVEIVQRLSRYDVIKRLSWDDMTYLVGSAAGRDDDCILVQLLIMPNSVSMQRRLYELAYDGAIDNNQLCILNCLLEMPHSRNAGFRWPKWAEKTQFFNLAIQRALWLSLQKQPRFSEIKRYDDLKHFAHRFLKEHPEWIKGNNKARFENEHKIALIWSLERQMRALAYYFPLLLSEKLTDNDAKHVLSYHQLPKTLRFFNEAALRPSRDVTIRLVKQSFKKRPASTQ